MSHTQRPLAGFSCEFCEHVPYATEELRLQHYGRCSKKPRNPNEGICPSDASLEGGRKRRHHPTQKVAEPGVPPHPPTSGRLTEDLPGSGQLPIGDSLSQGDPVDDLGVDIGRETDPVEDATATAVAFVPAPSKTQKERQALRDAQTAAQLKAPKAKYMQVQQQHTGPQDERALRTVEIVPGEAAVGMAAVGAIQLGERDLAPVREAAAADAGAALIDGHALAPAAPVGGIWRPSPTYLLKFLTSFGFLVMDLHTPSGKCLVCRGQSPRNLSWKFLGDHVWGRLFSQGKARELAKNHEAAAALRTHFRVEANMDIYADLTASQKVEYALKFLRTRGWSFANCSEHLRILFGLGGVAPPMYVPVHPVDHHGAVLLRDGAPEVVDVASVNNPDFKNMVIGAIAGGLPFTLFDGNLGKSPFSRDTLTRNIANAIAPVVIQETADRLKADLHASPLHLFTLAHDKLTGKTASYLGTVITFPWLVDGLLVLRQQQLAYDELEGPTTGANMGTLLMDSCLQSLPLVTNQHHPIYMVTADSTTANDRVVPELLRQLRMRLGAADALDDGIYDGRCQAHIFNLMGAKADGELRNLEHDVLDPFIVLIGSAHGQSAFAKLRGYLSIEALGNYCPALGDLANLTRGLHYSQVRWSSKFECMATFAVYFLLAEVSDPENKLELTQRQFDWISESKTPVGRSLRTLLALHRDASSSTASQSRDKLEACVGSVASACRTLVGCLTYLDTFYQPVRAVHFSEANKLLSPVISSAVALVLADAAAKIEAVDDENSRHWPFTTMMTTMLSGRYRRDQVTFAPEKVGMKAFRAGGLTALRWLTQDAKTRHFDKLTELWLLCRLVLPSTIVSLVARLNTECMTNLVENLAAHQGLTPAAMLVGKLAKYFRVEVGRMWGVHFADDDYEILAKRAVDIAERHSGISYGVMAQEALNKLPRTPYVLGTDLFAWYSHARPPYYGIAWRRMLVLAGLTHVSTAHVERQFAVARNLIRDTQANMADDKVLTTLRLRFDGHHDARNGQITTISTIVPDFEAYFHVDFGDLRRLGLIPPPK